MDIEAGALTRAIAAAAAALVLGACGTANPLTGSGTASTADSGGGAIGTSVEQGTPQVEPSAAYASGVDDQTQQGRVAAMTTAVDALRAASTSGWQAVQSDDNGYAKELSGGRYVVDADAVAAAEDFMGRFGGAFGPPAQFAFRVEPTSVDGVVTVVGDQVAGGVPVDQAQVAIAVRAVDGGSEVSSATGRVVDTTGVPTSATVPATTAVQTVATRFGVSAEPDPALLIASSSGPPALAWAVRATQGPTEAMAEGKVSGVLAFPALVFVDATSGEIVGARTTAKTLAQGRVMAAGNRWASIDLPPEGTRIVIERTLPNGMTVSANAERLADGRIALIDATGPKANRSTRAGVIIAFDHSKATDRNELGPLAVYASEAEVPDDAVLTMAGIRQSLDYYAKTFKRLSFDGKNSPVPVAINFTEDGKCWDNAYFSFAPGAQHMAIGVPCEYDGKKLIRTFASPSTIGHELTHGVTNSNARFLEGRSDVTQTAIDEGTADYFGVLIAGNFSGKINSTGDTIECFQIESSPMCRQFPDGSVGMRSLNTGATIDDYANVLSDPFGFGTLGDDGHDNSMVWTNALWQIRKAIAAQDGGDMLTSARARTFDEVVHRATTTYLTGTSDLVEAALAVQKAAADLGMTGGERNLIADRFRMNGLCPGCATAKAEFTPTATSGRHEARPAVAGAKVVFIENSGWLASSAKASSPGRNDVVDVLPKSDLTLTVAARGDWVAQTLTTLDNRTAVGLMNLQTGASETVATAIDDSVRPGVGSDLIAWTDRQGTVYARALAGGQVASLRMNEPVAALASDGDRVAIQTDSGQLSVWSPSSGQTQALDPVGPGRSKGAYLSAGTIAMWGPRLAVFEKPQGVGGIVIYDLDKGTKTVLDTKAVGFLGLAMNEDLVMWSAVSGPLPGLINELAGGKWPDTALVGYSISADKGGTLANPRGQQGFPALSDELAAWQETINGGQDIFAAPLN